MRIVLSLVLIAPVLTSAADALAQPTTNPFEAAAYVRTAVFAADGIALRCSRAYPSIAPQIERDLATWKRTDKVAIARAEQLWNEMQRTSPRSPEEERFERAQLDRLWQMISTPRSGEAHDGPQSRCLRFFRVRANGSVRAQAPYDFQLLEAR